MSPIDTARIEAAVAEIIAAIGDDPARPGLATTPQRVASAYADFFAGVGVDPVPMLEDGAEMATEPGERGELVVLRDIALRFNARFGATDGGDPQEILRVPEGGGCGSSRGLGGRRGCPR